MNNGQREFNPFLSEMSQQGAQQNAQQGSWFGPWGMGGANVPGATGMNRYQREPQKANSDFWVPVDSLEEAKAVFVQPGQKKWIMILNAMMFAVKSVNDAGVPNFKAFDFYPHTDVQVPQGMLDVWAWRHKKLVEKFNEAEVILQNYSKM